MDGHLSRRLDCRLIRWKLRCDWQCVTRREMDQRQQQRGESIGHRRGAPARKSGGHAEEFPPASVAMVPAASSLADYSIPRMQP